MPPASKQLEIPLRHEIHPQINPPELYPENLYCPAKGLSSYAATGHRQDLPFRYGIA